MRGWDGEREWRMVRVHRCLFASRHFFFVCCFGTRTLVQVKSPFVIVLCHWPLLYQTSIFPSDAFVRATMTHSLSMVDGQWSTAHRKMERGENKNHCFVGRWTGHSMDPFQWSFYFIFCTLTTFTHHPHPRINSSVKWSSGARA